MRALAVRFAGTSRTFEGNGLRRAIVRAGRARFLHAFPA